MRCFVLFGRFWVVFLVFYVASKQGLKPYDLVKIWNYRRSGFLKVCILAFSRETAAKRCWQFGFLPVYSGERTSGGTVDAPVLGTGAQCVRVRVSPRPNFAVLEVNYYKILHIFKKSVSGNLFVVQFFWRNLEGMGMNWSRNENRINAVGGVFSGARARCSRSESGVFSESPKIGSANEF